MTESGCAIATRHVTLFARNSVRDSFGKHAEELSQSLVNFGK